MPSERVWVIGAAADCDVVVDLPTISGRHCRLIKGPAGFLLEDLQSTNGTYVNGQRVTAPMAVTRTDVILLGSKVALPWPDLSASAVALPVAVPEVAVGAAPQSSDRRPIIAALCGVGLAAALLLYAVIDRGNRKGGPPPADAATTDRSSSSGHRQAEGSPALTTASTPEEARQPPPTLRDDDPPAKPSAIPDLETVVAAQERNVVWVGYRLRDFAFPYATGWLVRPDKVVTTATVVADLEPLSKEGIEPIVWREGQILAVKALRRHPAFDTENPGSRASMHSDIGIVELEDPVDANCPLATTDELAALNARPLLLAVGFESQLQENEPFDELKVKQVRHKPELQSSEFLASSSSRIYKLRAPTGKCWQGAPVFNDRGHVVGVLATAAGEARMVPVSQLSSLLKSTVNP